LSVVIDSSAVLAFVFEEPGGEVAFAYARHALLSAVNLDEVLHKALRQNIACADVLAQLDRLQMQIVPFDDIDAQRTASLHAPLHRSKISFADRACLALAIERGLPVVTADTDWLKLDLGLDIRLIR